MLLVCDVGNTNIVLGVYKGQELLRYWRISTDKTKTSDEIGIIVTQFFKNEGIPPERIKDIIISSVVPTIMYSLQHMAIKYFDKEALVVGPGIKTGINIKYDDPRQVGADRIVNAVACIHKYGGPCVIVDFGTATTFCAISDKNEYMGGTIAPGIKISSDALFQKASKLPKVELIKPEGVICKNTIKSIQSGVIYGYVGLVDYIVRRMKKELNKEGIKVIATGGLSSMIASESETIEIVDKFLTLDGLKIIYDMNQKS